MNKPRFDLEHGIWRCWSRTNGVRIAGFGRSVKEAWSEYVADLLRVLQR